METTDRQIAFQAMRTLECIGTYLFSRTHMLPPKTKKGKSELDNEIEGLMFAARVLTGKNDITENDLINIGVNGRNFRDYIQPCTTDTRYEEFMEEKQ